MEHWVDPTARIHPTAIVDAPVRIGKESRIWHFCHVMAGATLGDGCSLGQNCFVASGVVIGTNVKVQNNVSIYEGVELEDDVFCGPSMVFTNVINPRSAVVRRGEYQKTLVRRGASIGANATIVCGAVLGRYCFVGAGAVVRGSVPDHAVVAGVPGRVIGWMSRHGARLHPDAHGEATCPATGERYRMGDQGLVLLEEVG